MQPVIVSDSKHVVRRIWFLGVEGHPLWGDVLIALTHLVEDEAYEVVVRHRAHDDSKRVVRATSPKGETEARALKRAGAAVTAMMESLAVSGYHVVSDWVDVIDNDVLSAIQGKPWAHSRPMVATGDVGEA